MDKLLFCDNNGKILPEYIDVCLFICESQIQYHKWTTYNDEVTRDYSCYTNTKYFGRKTRQAACFLEKVLAVCDCFDVTTSTRLYLDLTVEFKSGNVEYMITTLQRLLEGSDAG